MIEGQLFPYAPPLIERLLCWLQYRLVFELDDAIYLTHGHERKMPVLLAMAAESLLETIGLAAYATQFSSQVTVVPTVVDTARFVPKPIPTTVARDPADETITVSGSASRTISNIWMWWRPRFAGSERYPVKLRVVCSQPRRSQAWTSSFAHGPGGAGWTISGRHNRCDAAGGYGMGEANVRSSCCNISQWDCRRWPRLWASIATSSWTGQRFLATTGDEWYERLHALCRQPELRRTHGTNRPPDGGITTPLALWGLGFADVYRSFAECAPNQAAPRPLPRPVSAMGTRRGPMILLTSHSWFAVLLAMYGCPWHAGLH